MEEVDNLLEKIADPITIMIRVIELWPNVSDFLRISRISVFLDCPPKILGGFTWRRQRTIL
jgi:hypothetical protein